MSYLKERAEWIKAGKPMRPEAEVSRIFKEECSPCDKFRSMPMIGGQCKLCGCFLHHSKKTANKLAWATTSCPKSPPKWEPYDTQKQ